MGEHRAMKVTKAHNMTREAAVSKIDGGFSELLTGFDDTVTNVNHSWKDDVMEFSFHARGFDFKGKVGVTDTDYLIDLDIPLMLRAFQGLVEEKLEEGLDEFLEE